ncbi:MAG: AAA family ATPase [Chlorobiaceae bacterium]|nr:AAA family ATPase [Chlorobiaceae bacterium]
MLKENAPREALPFGKPSKPLDILGFLKRYGLIVLVLGSFLFALTVPVVLLISKPNYEVHALMRIDPIIPSLITKSEDPSIINYYQDYANTQARRMMDFEILKKTVEKLTPRQKGAILPASLPPDKCADLLTLIIKVNPVNGTHLLDVSASSPKKEGLAPLINNFMQVFLEKVRKGNEMQDTERLSYLMHEKQALGAEIALIEEKLYTLTKEISTADFAETYNSAYKKSEQLQQLYVNALYDRISSENLYQETEKSGKQLKSLVLTPMVEELVMHNQSLDFTSSWTYQQQQQLRSSTDGLTPNNPDRIYVEERMKAMQDYERKLKDEVRSEAKNVVYGKRDYELRKELIQASNKSEKAKKSEKDILKELEESRKESVRVSVGLHVGESLKALLKHKRDLLDQIDTRIHELEVEGKAPLHIAIESAAREPQKPTGSNTQKLLMMFFAGAFGSVTALFLALEFFDNRIRRPEEIRQALGYPAAKPIVKALADMPFHELVGLAPRDPAAMAINSIAIGFSREKKSNNAQVIMFTGVNKGVGTTSIAFNCAQSLTRIAPKVLMIEADLPNPSLGRLNDRSPEQTGLADLLCSSAPMSDYIVVGGGYMPDTLYAGNTTTHGIPKHRIGELLEQAKNEYDFICIDCPPVLESDLTEHIALYSDIVALIILGDNTMFRDLRASAEALVRLEVPAIAPILNWNGKISTISVDKLLENRPEFLDKIKVGKIEALIQNLPPMRQLIETIKRTVVSMTGYAKEAVGAVSKKKQKPS